MPTAATPIHSYCGVMQLPQLESDVSGAVCIAKFGYQLFSYMNEHQNRINCECSSKQSLLVLPHTSRDVFFKGSTVVGLHLLARELTVSGVDHVILVGLGLRP